MEHLYHPDEEDDEILTEHVYRQPLTAHHQPRDHFEDDFYYHHHHRIPSPPEENFLSRFFSVFASRGTLVAISIAMIAVVITHYQDDVRAWYAYYFPPDVSWKDSLGTILLQSLQSLWGRIQYLASGAVWEKVADWTRRIRHAAMTRGGGDGDGDNAEMTHHDAAFRTIRADDLPALEATPVAPGALAAVVVSEEETRPKSSPSPRTRINTAPLEPAFLRESDYPPGWLVYHRVLGVVTKSEADDYNEKMGFPEDHDGEEDEVEDDLDDEEKKDEPSAAASTEEDMDEEKTVHHSNKSTGRNAAKAASTDNESSSSSSSNKKQSSSSFPIQHSIAASG